MIKPMWCGFDGDSDKLITVELTEAQMTEMKLQNVVREFKDTREHM